MKAIEIVQSHWQKETCSHVNAFRSGTCSSTMQSRRATLMQLMNKYAIELKING